MWSVVVKPIVREDFNYFPILSFDDRKLILLLSWISCFNSNNRWKRENNALGDNHANSRHEWFCMKYILGLTHSTVVVEIIRGWWKFLLFLLILFFLVPTSIETYCIQAKETSSEMISLINDNVHEFERYKKDTWTKVDTNIILSSLMGSV